MKLATPTIDDPATYWQAYHLDGEGRTRARYGYVCYALEGCPVNGHNSRPGFGTTEREALLDACYWSNQDPWVVVVPVSRVPQGVLEVWCANATKLDQ